MTDDVKHENSDDLFAADELSDEALDRAAGRGEKFACSLSASGTVSLSHHGKTGRSPA